MPQRHPTDKHAHMDGPCEPSLQLFVIGEVKVQMILGQVVIGRLMVDLHGRPNASV